LFKTFTLRGDRERRDNCKFNAVRRRKRVCRGCGLKQKAVAYDDLIKMVKNRGQENYLKGVLEI